MIITFDDSISQYIDILGKDGKSIIDAGTLLTTWNTKTKTGNERRCKDNSGDNNHLNTLFLDVKTTIPDATTIIKIPKRCANDLFVKAILEKLLNDENDIELRIDN